MLKRILGCSVLSLGLMAVISGLSSATCNVQPSQGAFQLTAKVPGEVAQALEAIGAGSAVELKGRLFTDRITVFTAEFRAEAVAALPTSIRDRRITRGKLFRRVEQVFGQMLQLHRRSGKVELFLFEDDIPNAMLFRGCVLTLSDGLADALFDGELAGVVTHELSHSYFEDEMAAARVTKDTRAMKVVELKCDAAAILSLKLLNFDPSLHLRGLQRIQTNTRRKGRSSGIFQSHPELVERAQFSQHFIHAMRSGEAGLSSNRVSPDGLHQLVIFQQGSVQLDQRTAASQGEKLVTPRIVLFSIIFQIVVISFVLISAATQAQTSRVATAASYLDRGNAWAAKGELEKAIANFDLAIASDPAHAGAYYNRAVVRFRKRDFDGALADFDRAIQLNPRFAEAYVDRAGIRYARRDLDGAISDNTKAIELNARFAQAWGNRGLARFANGDFVGAIKDCTRAIELNPRNADNYNTRGAARHHKGDLDGAINDQTQAIKLNPRFAVAYNDRGSARHAKGDLGAAIADYNRSIELNPHIAEYHGNRGLALLIQGKEEEAQQDFDQCLALDIGLKSSLDQRIKEVRERLGRKR